MASKFEDKMNKLEDIVSKLEQEDVELDESLKLYKDGLSLSKELTKQLNAYKEEIEKIEKENEQ